MIKAKYSILMEMFLYISQVLHVRMSQFVIRGKFAIGILSALSERSIHLY